MDRGLEVDIHLVPGIPEENFVAQALGNLAAYRLQKERAEALQWQVVRVEMGRHHHFRLILRHPTRRLDLGLSHAVAATLHQLGGISLEDLRTQLRAAEEDGLKPVPLRHLREVPDFWRDDFWNWLG